MTTHDDDLDRVPTGAIVEPHVGPIPPDDFTPRLLVLVANALLRRESQEFRRRFGLAANDWRVLSFAGVRPGVTATELVDLIAVDKALISRSVTALVQRGLVVLSDGPRGSRPIYLTEAGLEMRDAMLPLAMEAHEIVESVLGPGEIDVLNDRLRALLDEVRRRT